MAKPIEIGVGEGVRIILREDGSVGCVGANPERALSAAELCMRLGNRSKDKLEHIKNWIDLIRIQLAAEEFEKGVSKAAAPRLASAKKRLPVFAYPVAEKLILKQEREKRKTKRA